MEFDSGFWLETLLITHLHFRMSQTTFHKILCRSKEWQLLSSFNLFMNHILPIPSCKLLSCQILHHLGKRYKRPSAVLNLFLAPAALMWSLDWRLIMLCSSAVTAKKPQTKDVQHKISFSNCSINVYCCDYSWCTLNRSSSAVVAGFDLILLSLTVRFQPRSRLCLTCNI